MNQITKTRIDRISELHAEIGGIIRVTLDKAIEIGGLLAEQKAETGHGQWESWVSGNLPFDIRTAQRYMRAHENRDRIKNDTVSSLTDAYRMLEEPVVRKPVAGQIATPPGPSPPAPSPPAPEYQRTRVGRPPEIEPEADPFDEPTYEAPDTGSPYLYPDVESAVEMLLDVLRIQRPKIDPAIWHAVIVETLKRFRDISINLDRISVGRS